MDLLLQKYKKEREKNPYIQWQTYIQSNPDLKHIKSNHKAIEHWINHGLHENRKYNDENLQVREYWNSIHQYLGTDKSPANKTDYAFIITTSVRQANHLTYLVKCVDSIRKIYPNVPIYIIKDYCDKAYNIEKSLESFVSILIYDAIVRGAGEMNPYLFMLDPRCKHDKLIYIHDTVFLKKNIDACIASEEDILFFWYSNCCKFNDTTNKIENKEIFKHFVLYFGNAKIPLENYFNIIKNCKPFDVKFGSMSIFTKEFMKKVDATTNFVECSKYFTNRINRCFLERLMTILYQFIYNKEYNQAMYIVGDINKHPSAFMNSNPDLPYFPAVKVWQGR